MQHSSLDSSPARLGYRREPIGSRQPYNVRPGSRRDNNTPAVDYTPIFIEFFLKATLYLFIESEKETRAIEEGRISKPSTSLYVAKVTCAACSVFAVFGFMASAPAALGIGLTVAALTYSYVAYNQYKRNQEINEWCEMQPPPAAHATNASAPKLDETAPKPSAPPAED